MVVGAAERVLVDVALVDTEELRVVVVLGATDVEVFTVVVDLVDTGLVVEELLPVGLAVVVVFPVVVGFLVDDGPAVVLCVVVAWPVELDFFVVLVGLAGLAVFFVPFPALMGQCQQGLGMKQ